MSGLPAFPTPEPELGDWSIWILCACINFVGGYLFRIVNEKRKQKVFLRQIKKGKTASWQKLPSGFSRSSGECIGYVMPLEQHADWWVTRRNKTIMEGPAKTLDLGQKEVESALKEFA